MTGSGDFGVIANLAASGELTPTGLSIRDRIPFDEWEEIGRRLGKFRDLTAWALGDWLLYGEQTFGHEAAQAVEATGRKKDTLLQYVRVARQVPPSRRKPDVPWSHHQAVAALDSGEQDRLLGLADEQRLSLEEFRGVIRDSPARRLAGKDRRPDDAVVELVFRIARSILEAARPLSARERTVPVDLLDRLANALDEQPVTQLVEQSKPERT